MQDQIGGSEAARLAVRQRARVPGKVAQINDSLRRKRRRQNSAYSPLLKQFPSWRPGGIQLDPPVVFRSIRPVKCFASLLLVFGINTAGAEFDLVIRKARVIDGTGSPAAHHDIAIRDGKIAEIGKLDEARAREVIDAEGLVVAPGFIDVHTHAEGVVDQPDAHNFIRMGVTTILLGNCGGSALDLNSFCEKVENAKPAANVATLIGHNTVRRKAMGGSFDRPPTEDELAEMRRYVEEGMKAGAFGLSTGLIYLPGTFSRTEEIVELAKVASQFNGIYVSHMRDEALAIRSALDELFRIAREADIRAHISHLKLSGRSAWNQASEILALIDSARADGLDISQDQYTYTASSTGISQLVPEWAREAGKLGERLKDSKTKAKIVDEMRGKLKRRAEPDYSYAVIAYDRRNPDLNGLNIAEAAEKKLGSRTLESQIELILDLVSNGSPSGVFHGMSEDDLQAFMRHPHTMFASDSGVRRFNAGVPHPRGYGNNARVLARYTREKKVLRLEEAVRRMTSLPASVFRFEGRGQIQEGFWADLVIFNPQTVEDTATFTAPHAYAKGIEYVLVNGTPVIANGQPTGQRPGAFLRLNSRE